MSSTPISPPPPRQAAPKQAAPKPAAPRAALIFVAFIVFIDMTGLGLIVPVMPALISSLGATSTASAAAVGGWLLFSYALMQFLFAPIIGGLSDRYGRRPVLLITLLILGVDYAIMAWAPNLTWLFIGRVLAGIMGASWAAANSCVSDVAPASEKAKYFGLLGGAGAMGFVLGPALGGMLGEYHERLPFVFASLLALGGTGIGFFVLKETLHEDNRRRFTLARANPLGSLIQMSKTPIVLGLLTVIFMLQLAAQVQLSVWAFFLVERFEWSELQIGLSVTLFGFLLALVQGVLTGRVIARYGSAKTGLWSIALGLPAYLMFAFAGAGWVMIAGIIVGALGAFAFPAMQDIMSSNIPSDAQGELQGAIASTISLTSIIGPVLMTYVFKVFADQHGLYFPGAPFLLAFFICLCAALIYGSTVKRFSMQR